SGSCEHKVLTSTANASESGPTAATAPAAPAPAPAATTVTPRTESPDVAKNLSKAFAATAKAVAPSVVRIDVRAGRSPIAERGGGGRPDPFGGSIPPMFRRFFDFGDAQPDFPGPGMPAPIAGTGSGIVID